MLSRKSTEAAAFGQVAAGYMLPTLTGHSWAVLTKASGAPQGQKHCRGGDGHNRGGKPAQSAE